jgi:SAM-dependent methyltransferase
MKEPINFDSVADIYDLYVNTDFDIPFFINETARFKDEILELMCGTGRVSLPLLEAGKKLTCVDYSEKMLEIFREKAHERNLTVNLVRTDVKKMNLGRRFGMILLPFHSLAEILSEKEQLLALKHIAMHLKENGTFILTLQNPVKRIESADGTLRKIGSFNTPAGSLIVSCINNFDPADKIVSGFQYYEFYDKTGILTEKRELKINFRPLFYIDLLKLLDQSGLQITDIYGDYKYSLFSEDDSQFMICRVNLKRK